MTRSEPQAREPDPDPEGSQLLGLRIAIIYDGLFPWDIGGIERWYRALAERLAYSGAEISYLTRLHWDDADAADIPGVRVIAITGRQVRYHADGTRRALQPLKFGLATFLWLVRHRGTFDAIHVGNFPYFSLIGSRAALIGTRVPVNVDWFEVWPSSYWRQYAGFFVGTAGWLVQSVCMKLTTHGFVFWNHTELRLRQHGFRNDLTVLPGLLPSESTPQLLEAFDSRSEPFAFASGRHIKDKGFRLLPEAIALTRMRVPGMRLVIAGEGPDTPVLHGLAKQLDVEDVISFVGKVSDDELRGFMARARCVIVSSYREGYGLAVVEAAAAGTPSVVTANPENAAIGHIVEGTNGYVVDPSPRGIAEGLVHVMHEGIALPRAHRQMVRRGGRDGGHRAFYWRGGRFLRIT